jgi:hypothetical protein
MTAPDRKIQRLEGGRGWAVTANLPGEPGSLREGAPATVGSELWQGRGGMNYFSMEIEPEHARWLAADLLRAADIAQGKA